MRDVLKVYLPILLLVLGGFAAAYHFVAPAPPRTIRLAAGAEQGAYAESARRYREILARDGIRLEVQTTLGSLDNLRRLRSDAADVGFVQGGTVSAEDEGLTSIASLFFEPLWIFVRADRPARRPADLRGRRLAVGPEGSGTRALALQLLAAGGITDRTARVLPTGGGEAVQGLLQGSLDAAFFVTGRPLPMLEPLLRSRRVRLMSLAQADAFTQRFPFLSKTVMPEGRLDLAANIPSRDTILLAPTATLAARSDLHPAIIDRLIQAAGRVHADGGLVGEPGQFPSRRFVDLPLHPDAERYLRSGPTFLRRHLPFWVATTVERFLVMLVPLVTLMIPLVRFAPPLYRWQVRRRIYRWYRNLRDLERQAEASPGPADRSRLLDELAALEAKVARLSVPLGHADSFYQLRAHIQLIRRQLEASASPRQVGEHPAPRN